MNEILNDDNQQINEDTDGISVSPSQPPFFTREDTERDPYGLSQHAPGAKLDAGKPDCDLVFSGFRKALLEVAKVGTCGAEKYTANGWKRVPNGVRRYRSAAYRHLLTSEFLDEEWNLPHLAHAAWNCLAALELMMKRNR